MFLISQGKTNWKFLIIVFVLATIASGGVLYFYFNLPQYESAPLNFPSKLVKMEGEEAINRPKERKFGIFGDGEFDTVVSGYLELKEEEIFGTEAFFVITKFYDNAFMDSIDEGISTGNTVNIWEGGFYKFNLGCFDNGKIIGFEYEEDKIYIDEETAETIINSSKENPVSIILSFGEHLGFGCTCCNIAHHVRIYETETYRNEEYGFEFEYPNIAQLSVNTNIPLRKGEDVGLGAIDIVLYDFDYFNDFSNALLITGFAETLKYDQIKKEWQVGLGTYQKAADAYCPTAYKTGLQQAPFYRIGDSRTGRDHNFAYVTARGIIVLTELDGTFIIEPFIGVDPGKIKFDNPKDVLSVTCSINKQ